MSRLDNGYRTPWGLYLLYLLKSLTLTGAVMAAVYVTLWPAPVQPRCEAAQQPDTPAQECRRK